MVITSFSHFSIADKTCLATFFFCLFFLCACSNPAPEKEGVRKVTKMDTVMGTVGTVTLYEKEGQKEGDKLCDELFTLAHRLEEDSLSRKLESSEIFRINKNAGDEKGLEPSTELKEVLTACLQLSERTGGAFDISIGALTELWNMDEIAAGTAEARIPGKEEIERARKESGYQNVTLQDDRVYVKNGTLLDLGSVGKGFALDEISKHLREQDSEALAGGIVSLGGSIYTFGEKGDGTPWKVGVKDPEDVGEIVGYLQLDGEWYVSTSGDYERFFEENGERYSHILDPNTGYPVKNNLRSVTVLARNGLLSDALSTACFVMGEDGAKALAEEYEAELLLINDEGEIWLSDGMQECFKKKEGR